jgi:L-iditol 2-dehydrogenase
MPKPGVIEFRDVDVPKIAGDEVLLRILRIGVCGSDLHVFHGKHPYTPYPVVQGHEVSGEVVELGEGVRSLDLGDKVTFMPQVTCGACYACRSGNYHICESLKVMGFQTTGAASEFFAVKASKVIRLPSELSIEEGAMVEPLAVAVHALSRSGNVEGKKVLVLGAGPIGHLVAQTARGLGASAVMITDISAFRRQMAAQCGIDYCVNPAQENLAEAIQRCFGSDKADLILECVGIEATTTQAIACARKGSTIVVVGVFAAKALVDLGLLQDRELRLVGTLMYQEHDYRKAIELIRAGKVNLKPLVTNHFAFEDYLSAYRFIDEKKDLVMKVMIDVGATA